MNTIEMLQKHAWQVAEDKGFHVGRTESRDDTIVRLALVGTEVSEAIQEVKRHWLLTGPPSDESRNRFAEELADTAIRLLDLAECTGVDLQSAIIGKMEKNAGRPYLYGTAKSVNTAVNPD